MNSRECGEWRFDPHYSTEWKTFDGSNHAMLWHVYHVYAQPQTRRNVHTQTRIGELLLIWLGSGLAEIFLLGCIICTHITVAWFEFLAPILTSGTQRYTDYVCICEHKMFPSHVFKLNNNKSMRLWA